MKEIEDFKNLSIEDKKEIIDSYFTEDLKTDELTIIQYLFFKCVKICQDSNADNIKLSSDLNKINKRATFCFELNDL